MSYAVDTDKLAKLPREGKFADWTKYSFWGARQEAGRNARSPTAMPSYQTYLNPGLPDGPIGSPTLASIEAAATRTRGAATSTSSPAKRRQKDQQQVREDASAHRERSVRRHPQQCRLH